MIIAMNFKMSSSKRIAIVILMFVATAWVVAAQQPAAERQRRGLDQIDLLSVRTDKTTTVAAPVVVDLATMQLLEPLVRYCRELERSYNAEVMAKPEPLTREAFDKVFRQKATAIHRSLFMIRQMQELSPEVSALLNDTDESGKEIGLVAVGMQLPYELKAQLEVEFLKTKYGLDDAAGYKELIAVVLRRMNLNFGRLKLSR